MGSYLANRQRRSNGTYSVPCKICFNVQNQEKNEYLGQQNVTYRENINENNPHLWQTSFFFFFLLSKNTLAKQFCINLFLVLIESAHWADLIQQSRCPCVVVSLFLCLSSPFHVLDFEVYFAPTFRSWMSKTFRDLESLGKSAGKK